MVIGDRELEKMKRYLREYDGPLIRVMEVCGSHTAAIAKNGIRGLLSENIRLISGPGCPVCVTTSAYIDRLLDLAIEERACIVTFGDLMRVPGSKKSLGAAMGEGARVKMVYSPMDVLKLAQKEPQTQFVFAAIGFETTTPVYALLVRQLTEQKVKNVRLLTSLKMMPPVIDSLCSQGAPVDAFLAPGHVCAVTGSKVFEPLAKKYGTAFAVSGFGAREILASLYALVRMMNPAEDVGVDGNACADRTWQQSGGRVMNFYPSVVSREGNLRAMELVRQIFEPADACWRGLGRIKNSGLLLREEYREYDAGSAGLFEDRKKNTACRCDQVLMGKLLPQQCPLFGTVCTPLTPQGACMVSEEGSCAAFYANGQ